MIEFVAQVSRWMVMTTSVTNARAATIVVLGFVFSTSPAAAQNASGYRQYCQTINGHLVCGEAAGSPGAPGARPLRYGRTAVRRGRRRARTAIRRRTLLLSRSLSALTTTCTVSAGSGGPACRPLGSCRTAALNRDNLDTRPVPAWIVGAAGTKDYRRTTSGQFIRRSRQSVASPRRGDADIG
jgi:hypothetical protein